MKKIILLLLFCVLFSCERKEPNFSKEMIEKLSYMQEDSEGGLLPSQYLRLELYLVTKDGRILRCNNHELFFSYKKYYSNTFESFDEFLNAVLNVDFFLKDKNLKNFNSFYSFKLNPKLKKEYYDLGFENFLKKYSKGPIRKGELEFNKSDLKNDEYFTIAYYLYVNQYDISQDCYLGKDYIYKREDYFK